MFLKFLAISATRRDASVLRGYDEKLGLVEINKTAEHQKFYYLAQSLPRPCQPASSCHRTQQSAPCSCQLAARSMSTPRLCRLCRTAFERDVCFVHETSWRQPAKPFGFVRKVNASCQYIVYMPSGAQYQEIRTCYLGTGIPKVFDLLKRP